MITINKAIKNAIQDFYNPIPGVCWLQENVFYAYFPNVLLDLEMLEQMKEK